MHPFASRLLLSVCFVLLAALPARADGDVITVRILEQAAPSSVVVSSAQSPLDVFAGEFDQPIGTIAVGEEAPITQSSGQLSILVDGMRLFAEELRIRGGASLLVRVESGSRTGVERLLPGELQIRPGSGGRLMLDNVLDVEAYVASVVAHEYGFDDLEGSKAMAVVARTFALRRLQSANPLTDHIEAQVYGDERRVTDVARRAAEATRGEILTYDGELIEAVYSSSSGGRTANNEDVWDGEPLPYLRSRNDPFDRESPHREWTARVDRDELLRAVSREMGFSVSGFIAGDRGPDGRVRTVELLSTSGPRREVTANRFRLMVNRAFGVNSLKSTNFDARREGGEYVFSGAGFGHGVGLNQHGARYLANQGYSYRDILGFYYSDVRLATHRSGRASGQGELLLADQRLLADAGEPLPDRRGETRASDDPPIAERQNDSPRREEQVTSGRAPAHQADRASAPKTGKRIGW